MEATLLLRHPLAFLFALGHTCWNGVRVQESRLSVRLEQLEDSDNGICDCPLSVSQHVYKTHRNKKKKNMAGFFITNMIPDIAQCELGAWLVVSKIVRLESSVYDRMQKCRAERLWGLIFDKKWHKILSGDMRINTNIRIVIYIYLYLYSIYYILYITSPHYGEHLLYFFCFRKQVGETCGTSSYVCPGKHGCPGCETPIHQGCTQSCNGAQCHKGKLLQPTSTTHQKEDGNDGSWKSFRKQLLGSKLGFFQARMSVSTESFCRYYSVECISQWISTWRSRMPVYQNNITRHQR